MASVTLEVAIRREDRDARSMRHGTEEQIGRAARYATCAQSVVEAGRFVVVVDADGDTVKPRQMLAQALEDIRLADSREQLLPNGTDDCRRTIFDQSPPLDDQPTLGGAQAAGQPT